MVVEYLLYKTEIKIIIIITAKAKWFWQKIKPDEYPTASLLAKHFEHFSSLYPKNEFQFHLIPTLLIGHRNV